MSKREGFDENLSGLLDSKKAKEITRSKANLKIEDGQVKVGDTVTEKLKIAEEQMKMEIAAIEAEKQSQQLDEIEEPRKKGNEKAETEVSTDGRGRPADKKRNAKPVTFILAEKVHEGLHDAAYQERKTAVNKSDVSMSKIAEKYIREGLQRDGYLTE